ncbi:MAG: disulfide bond formation protein B [Candidatus Paceibacterota bacterium]
MNIEMVHYLNIFLGIGAIGLQIALVVTLLLLFFGPKENKFLGFIKEHFIVLGFWLSIVPMVFSLFYSEILNYVPCYHCWIQRIFMFPQVFLFGVAWIRKDRNVFWYSLPLLVAGTLDALYLNYIYYFKPESAPCDVSGVSCAQRLVSEFGGYISIPMLGLTSFISLLALLAVAYFYQKEGRK